jgi:uncharacterized protein YneF (UPF0154 family)
MQVPAPPPIQTVYLVVVASMVVGWLVAWFVATKILKEEVTEI